MMPNFKSENFGSGDQSWLGSAHGIANCRTEKLKVSTFTKGTHYPDGFIPSGTPVAKVGGELVAYDATEATVTDAGVIAGHIFTDQVVGADAYINVPLLDHGRVKADKVPGDFTVPAAPEKLSATTIVYL